MDKTDKEYIEQLEEQKELLLKENNFLNVTVERLRADVLKYRTVPNFKPKDPGRPTIDEYLLYFYQLPQYGHNMLGHVVGSLSNEIDILLKKNEEITSYIDNSNLSPYGRTGYCQECCQHKGRGHANDCSFRED